METKKMKLSEIKGAMGTNENPIIIKKYPNRKLYNTKESCYLTLSELQEIIEKGVKVKVVENRTLNDITSNVMIEIIALKAKQFLDLQDKDIQEKLEGLIKKESILA